MLYRNFHHTESKDLLGLVGTSEIQLLMLVLTFAVVHLVVVRESYTTQLNVFRERCRIRASLQRVIWAHPVSTPLQKRRCIFRECHRLITQAQKQCSNQCETFSNTRTITTNSIRLMLVMADEANSSHLRNKLRNRKHLATSLYGVING